MSITNIAHIFASVSLIAAVAGWPSSHTSASLSKQLIAAVKRNDLAAAKLLLSKGADPNIRETHVTKPSLEDQTEGGKPYLGDTVLMMAARECRMQMAKLLLDTGANVNGTGERGLTPLIEAAGPNGAAMVKLLLARGARPNQRNEYGDTAIVFAANRGQVKIVDLLLRAGAGFEGGSGWSPLMDAAYCGHTETVKFLIRKGADVNLHRKNYMTPLECAVAQGQDEIATLLRNAGAKGIPPDPIRRKQQEAKWDEEKKKEDAERHANALKWKNESILTQDDKLIIEAALLDVLSHKSKDGEDTFDGDRTESDIILEDTTVYYNSFIDGSLNAALDELHALQVTLEMRQDMQRRNWEPISLANYKPVSPVGSSRVDLQACKLEYSIVSPK